MKGIYFKEPLFHATIEGRKTQTRRIVKPQPKECLVPKEDGYQDVHYDNFKPRYKVGERVFLKEPYYIREGIIIYKYHIHEDSRFAYDWENKLFLPAKFARYFIDITAVRCERLQDISEEDCRDECCRHIGTDRWVNDFDGKVYETSAEAYAALINSINGNGTWESNPYVWIYEYKLVK